ncbi:hypothetical protein BDB00DRAFT_879125 [Zychaea mexicana]|uniref:uncharacterized protein n=1 Tax=Zychaea mexicana TaxID=64656 RepID=UPI0022FDF061|nr:uncharacterized protein BDB00DRAFT_879125 [Zychaea mexicana]KAI9482528.1 hypothetical protein BDB00DRAFT_879125 [Zychaea mexicana]
MDQSTTTTLHQTLPGSGTIGKKKKSRKPKFSPEERVALEETAVLEDKVGRLTQVKRYMQKGEEAELEELVAHWRSVCQNITMEIICVLGPDDALFQPTIQSAVYSSWGYDDAAPAAAATEEDGGYERELSSLEQPTTTSTSTDDSFDDMNCRRRRHGGRDDSDEEEEDDVTRLLAKLHIDPELIHYSPERGEFY